MPLDQSTLAPSSAQQAPSFEDLVDLQRYPLDGNDPATLDTIIQQARGDLRREGCARLPAFIRPAWHATLNAETRYLAPLAHIIESSGFTPYVGPADESFPPEHPRRRLQSSTNGFVGRDQIHPRSPLNTLYLHPQFHAFVAACLEKTVIYPFADPIRGLAVNVMPTGSYLAWHFDANEFIVSLMTQPAQTGGVFEYCPHIRAPGAEHYDDVQGVLDGDRRLVKALPLQVGDLQLFCGRYSLHRVTETQGERHCVLFGYAEEPGFIGAVKSTLKAFGRVSQAHLEAERQQQHHGDGLTD